MKKIIIATIAITVTLGASAQRVTYNHDASKMNQVTVQEIGSGSLTPSLYYTLFHNGYRKTAAAKNNMSFRTLTGISAYQQIDDAKKLDSAMVKRAEIEALNMADRQIDLAWAIERSKIENKLADYQRNINRIQTVGGQAQHQSLWIEKYNMFTTAIKAIQQAYMPNSQRKKEYLRIYADIVAANNNLLGYLVQLDSRDNTAQLLSASYDLQDRRGEIAAAAMNRWRGAGWNVTNK